MTSNTLRQNVGNMLGFFPTLFIVVIGYLIGVHVPLWLQLIGIPAAIYLIVTSTAFRQAELFQLFYFAAIAFALVGVLFGNVVYMLSHPIAWFAISNWAQRIFLP